MHPGTLVPCLFALSLALSPADASSAPGLPAANPVGVRLELPPEFQSQLVAGEPLIRFPMFACFDDAGRLYVAESSGRDLYAGLQKLTRDCRVSRIEDADGDGVFERGVVFQDRVTFPMGLAWRDGRLYLADPPDLVALTDLDEDGRADRREVVLTGFGHTDNGSLHGLTFGPDGLLYFTMGEPDGWRLPRGDGSFLEGVAGALFRSRPDGTHPEVISRGFVNLVEVEFLPGGECIGTDNWYQKPAGGYRDALVDCAPGGLFPYAADRGTPLPRSGVTLPALTLLPAVAHSGIARPRGTGLPSDWRTSLLAAQHNTRKVARHALSRDGASFAAAHFDLVTSDHPDFHPSDVVEDADGSFLIVDTGGWYVEHCPTGRIRDSRAPGGIHRLRWTHAPRIADPRGRQLLWERAPDEELARHLRDRRPAVAERASRELVKRGATRSLASVAAGAVTLEARLHAAWALAQIPSREALPPLRGLLSADDPELVCATARALAMRRDTEAGDRLAGLLDSPRAPVRRAAAEALVKCGSRAHAPRLANLLASSRDDFERHACILALHSLADEPFVRTLLTHEKPQVRSAGLQLLDQPPLSTLRFADLAPHLRADDAALRRGAVHLLERHPDWAEATARWLREQLALPSLDEPSLAALNRLFTAFQSQPVIRALIGELLEPARGSAAVRRFLLELLPALTAQPPEAAWLRAIGPALEVPGIRRAAIAAAMVFPQPGFEPALAGLAESDDRSVPEEERLLAARAIVRSRLTLSDRVFLLALGALASREAARERLQAVELLSAARLSPDQLPGLLNTLRGGVAGAPDKLVPCLLRAVTDATRPALAAFFASKLEGGWAPTRAVLDQALSAFPDGSPRRSELQALWETSQSARLQRLRELSPLLAGGDPERGRESFALATCGGCHRVGGLGGDAGPDLTRIGSIRSGDDVLESIVFPSSSFAQGYEPYRLERRDGEEFSGSLIAQDRQGVTLRDSAGSLRHVRADEIVSLTPQELSAMPEGLDQLLTRDQFRDLLAYLQSLR